MQFNVGDTRTVNGVTYQRQADGRWVPQGGGQGQLVPVAPPKPGQDVDLARDQVGLARDRAALETAPYDASKAASDARKAELEVEILERKAADPTGALGVEQGKATGFYSRAAKANQAYEELGVDAEPISRSVGRSLVPDSLEGFITSGPRQSAEANARAFIGSVLRYESGAAIPPEEFDSAYKTYFPLPGEDEAAIATKARLRAEAIEALKIGSGPGAASVRLDDDAFQTELQRIVNSDMPANEKRAAIAAFMQAQGASEKEPGEIDAALEAGGATVLPPEQAEPGIWDQLRGATQNVIAGVGQGIAAIPDAATNALGAVTGAVADSIPGVPEWASDALKNPVTIGGAIERAVPTPQDGVGQGVRFTSQLAGGVAGTPQRAVNALTNAVVGKVPTAPAQNALATGGRQTADAAQRQGVELLPADVGGRAIKGLTSAAGQAPVSAGSVTAVSRRAADQMGDAASRAAGQAGRVLPEDEAGEIVRAGGNKFIEQSKRRASAFYDKAHEAAEGVTVQPTQAVAVIEREIARKSQAGEMSGDIVRELETVKRSLTQEGGLTAVGIREARTILGAMARNDKLRGTDAKRIFGEVLDAASADMEQSLIAAGREGAARLFRRADTLWRERIAEIDEVLEPIIGKSKSGEDIVRAVEGMARGARGGVSRLGRMLSALPASERGDITATVIDRMGRATASAQDEAGSVFSSETFLTNWNKMSPKGKAALFGSGEVRRNLDDIARIAAARRDTASLASRSNTPIGIMGNVGTIASTGIAWGPAPFALLAIQYGAGKALASPAFTRWLARTPRNPKGLKAHVGRLSAVASQNPELADDIANIQRQLLQAANDNAGQVSRSVAGNNEEQR